MSDRYSLGLITGRRGACSETFVRRHIRELKPAETVTIAWFVDSADNCWRSPGPELIQGPKSLFKIRRAAYRGLCSSRASVGMRSIDFGPWQAKVKRFLKQHQVRVALGEFLDVSYTYIDTFKSLGVPFYAHAHGYDISKLARQPYWQERYRKFNESSGIITINQVSRKRLMELGVESDRVHVIPYGVDVPPERPHRVREGMPHHDRVRCLAVGRMTAKKAPILLLTAFHRAVSEFPNLSLDFAGDGELMPAVVEFIRNHKLSERVTVHGWRDSDAVRRLMSEADMFLQHSIVDPVTGDEEGLPVAILEAMAHGLPVVSTRHAGIPEQVLEKETGYLVEEQDTDAMADRIVDLARNHGRRQDFGEAGWRRARDHFSWRLEKKRLLELMGLSE